MCRALTESMRRWPKSIRARSAGMIVNMQGDLPTLEPGNLAAAVALLDEPAVDIATLAAEIQKGRRARQSQRG